MSFKVLYVGDPHARPDCLEEMDKLVDFICETAKREGVWGIVLLGDQFHTHSIIHLSVLAFWRSAFKKLCASADAVFALVGNHDMSGRNGDPNNAMMLFSEPNLIIVDKPLNTRLGFMVPYVKEPAEFIKIAQQHADRVLICHQTFVGSVYENGYPAKDGIDPNLIPQKHVISGHIHTPQNVGKVWYPGSPRWQTISDANVSRAIWVVEHPADDTMEIKHRHSTHKVCKPIELLSDRPDEPAVLPDYPADVIVDVFGEPDHVRMRTEVFEKAGVRVRPFPTLKRTPKVKESDGLTVSFEKFIGQYQSKNGTARDRLLELAKQRISWLRAT